MAGDLNPFAFKLSSELVGDVFNVNYYLNAPATSVKVTITLPNKQTVVYNCTDSLNTSRTKKVKGIYELKISLREYINNIPEFRECTDLPWSVDVMGGYQPQREYETETITYYNTSETTGANTYQAKVLNAQEVTKKYRFVNPTSIDIDNNTQSDNFGMIYCTEARIKVEGTSPNYTNASDAVEIQYDSYWGTSSSATGGCGLFVFDPAFQIMTPSKDNYDFVTPKTDADRTIPRGYDMGFADRNVTDNIQTLFLATNAKGEEAKYVRPMLPRRVRLSEDGSRVYVTAYTTTGQVLAYRLASKFNYGSDAHGHIIRAGSNGLVLDGNDTDYSGYPANMQYSYNVENSSGNFVGGPNIAFDVRGFDNSSENKITLLMLSGSRYSSNYFLSSSIRCDEYNLGTATSWTTTPTKTGWFDRVVNSTSSNIQQNILYINKSTDKAVPFVTSYVGVNVEYDQNGGFWLINQRDNHSNMASLLHMNADKTITFAEYWANRGSGAIKYIDNYNKLLVSGGPFIKKWTTDSQSKTGLTAVNGKYGHPAAMGSNDDGWWLTIYSINKNNVKNSYINTSTSDYKTYMNSTKDHRKNLFSDSIYVRLTKPAAEFVLDYAENLYVVSGGDDEYIRAYALPRNNKTASTPCKTNYYFNTPTQSVKVQITPNKSCGNVVDHACPQMTQYWRNAEPNAFDYYYLADDADGDNTNATKVKFQLEARPAAGYRFYTWDNVVQDKALNSVTTVQYVSTYAKTNNDEKGRTAHFGIDVWETKPITQTDEQMTFKGVFVQRELDAESYSTICLPFNLTTLDDTPFENATVMKFTGAEEKTENGDKRILLTFTPVSFTGEDIMQAGQPYLIKVNAPIEGGVDKIFNNVTCPPIGAEGGSVTINDVTFKGILNPTTFDPSETNLFLVADDRLATLTAGGTINGLRAYFTVPAGVSPSNVQIKIMDKAPTGVENLDGNTQPTKYMQDGQVFIQQAGQVFNTTGAHVK